MSTQLATTSNDLLDVQTARESAAFDLLQRQAKMLSSSTLVPKEFQNNIANCGIAINMARRLQADPFMICQNVDIIHGRPSFRASFLIAMVNASGRFEPLQFEMTETGKETTVAVTFETLENQRKVSRELQYTYTPTTCIAYAKDKASGAIIKGPPVSYDMAISEGWVGKSGSKWQTAMRELMIRYRAAAFFARLYAPDITLGMQTAEEVYDTTLMHDVTPSRQNTTAARATPLDPFAALPEPAESAPVVDIETEAAPEDPELELLTDMLTLIADAKDAETLTSYAQQSNQSFSSELNTKVCKRAIADKAKTLGLKWVGTSEGGFQA